MSCGLGAVVLVFMLVKYNTTDSVTEKDFLKNDIQQLEEKREELEITLQKLIDTYSVENQEIQSIQKRIADQKKLLSNKDSNISQMKKDLAQLKKDIKDTKVEKKTDTIKIENKGEENYILGLKVEGKKIVILLDASASMTNEKLINIIKVKNGSKEDKLKASKWLRTKKIIGWLLARLPASSEVMVIAYNDDIHFLGGRNWIGRGSSEDIQSILKDLAVLIPEGGTNLQKGLRTARNFKPTNLYLITDGLPTIGESRFSGLNPFATCNSLLGKSSKISGECRIKLFQHSIYENMPPGVIGTPRINVILLPIEGDPDAVNEYWAWSSATGGLLISPASDWP
ncbi:MAG TPA: VWA domain-containing protein [Gammaproteobacteria bacterium]|nr:VWA domain-containing protein [Gammaproteobacteria bacterium]